MSGWDKERGKVTDVCDFWKGFRKFSDVRFVSWHLWIRMGEHSQENRNRDLRTMTFVFWIFRKKNKSKLRVDSLWLLQSSYSGWLKIILANSWSIKQLETKTAQSRRNESHAVKYFRCSFIQKPFSEAKRNNLNCEKHNHDPRMKEKVGGGTQRGFPNVSTVHDS